jgi:site-specific DNA-methyltransferase (adenine-specific)
MHPMANKLYYGDNLEVLRESIADESVDLVYLDPPFNSNAGYNVLFKAPAGQKSEAQIEAFEDTWHWTESAARAYEDVIRSRYPEAATMLKAMRSFLGENDMMAYLAMMAVRLIELHRVMKPNASVYLHCDPTASHYLKILLDAIFGPKNYLNEIIWQRSNAHNTAKRYGKIADTIFFYSKSDNYIWNQIYTPYSEQQLSRYKKDEDGRLYRGENLTADRANSSSGKFEWRGTMPPNSRGWGYNIEQLEKWWTEGRILKKKDGTPRMDGLKIYLEDTKGKPLQSVWTDIDRIGNTSGERLGYPTQKPLALLERILQVSSNPGDVVLDPFCGCGTAVHAAQKLERQWIGIDITHLAVSLIERRLKDAFPGIAFEVHGTPKDIAGARDLAERDKYQFEWWAVSLVDAVPQGGKKKGMDRGIDGIRWVRSGPKDEFEKVLVSVKGGENVGAAMVRDLKGTIEREGALGGMFVTLAEPTREMTREAAAAGFFETSFGTHPKIQILTIAGLLAGQKPNLPSPARGEGFKQAPKETGLEKQSKLNL